MVQGTGRLDTVMPRPVSSPKTASSHGASSFADRLEKATAAPVDEKVEESKRAKAENEVDQVEKILDSILEIVEEDGMPMKLEDNPELQTLIQQLYVLMDAQSPELKNENNFETHLSSIHSSAEEWMRSVYDLLATVQKTLGTNAEKTIPQGLQEKFRQVLDLLKGAASLRDAAGVKHVKIEADALQVEGIQEAVTQPVKPLNTAEQGTSSQQQPGKEQRQLDSLVQSVAPAEGDTVKIAHHQLSGVMPVGSKEAASTGKVHIPLVPSRFFVNEMEALILKQVQMNRGTGAMETVIRLFPENLGRVDVRISALNGNIVAQFITTNVTGKEAVEQHLNQLRQALAQHGLSVEKLEVTQLQTSAGNSSTNQDALNGQGREQSQREQQQTSKEEEDQPVFNLADLLNEEEAEAAEVS